MDLCLILDKDLEQDGGLAEKMWVRAGKICLLESVDCRPAFVVALTGARTRERERERERERGKVENRRVNASQLKVFHTVSPLLYVTYEIPTHACHGMKYSTPVRKYNKPILLQV